MPSLVAILPLPGGLCLPALIGPLRRSLWAAASEGLDRSDMSKGSASGAQLAHALSASHCLLTD